ncbi:MAG: GAF domain-containing protein [Acidobacteria bacterium]|nr:MAG: GAF domain-containing protein [Acidobacteriota bacterium]
METTQSNHTRDAIQQVHKQFSDVLSRQTEQIERLSHSLKSLQDEQRQLEAVASQILEPLERSLAGEDGTETYSPSGILAGVRRLTAATCVEQVFDALAERAVRMGVRAVVFGVRGRVAWGASAGGYGPELSGNNLRILAVPLNHEGPFGQAFESGESVEARAADLEKNRNLLAKLTPSANARILLIPVRAAGSVVGIFYAETGERRNTPLLDSLKVYAEFAGAQMDRLLVVNGGIAAVDLTPGTDYAESATEQADGDELQAAPSEAKACPEIPLLMASAAVSSEPAAPPAQSKHAVTAPPEAVPPPEEAPAPTEAVGITHSPEGEERILRDARRFSKLLVSEIELYNKNGVEEGRRNRDLYQRLKKDIDRSRETYEKRFAHTVAKQFDYFHEELVRTLADNDPLLLGSGYPGPSV